MYSLSMRVWLMLQTDLQTSYVSLYEICYETFKR